MKILIRCLFVSACFAGVGMLLHAQDAEKERVKGRVLLFKNGHAMEGEIERVGTQMCVRRGTSEVWIAADKAARLCEDWDDAYAYVRSLVNPEDADAVVKLARWCHLHRLTDKALAQARHALTLQPTHRDAKQIVTMLERMKHEPSRKPTVTSPVLIPKVPDPTVDVTSESSIAFTTRVQPILMNTCVSCHAGNHGGEFHLERVNDNSQKAATLRNLAAVMAYIDLDRPAISPLLTRAITPHGDVPMPAIKDRSSKPFQTIQQWIEMTVARNPHLKDYAAAKKDTPVKRETESDIVTTSFASQKVEPADRTIAPATKSADSAPRLLPMLTDRYGADQFNKQFHPDR